MYNIRTIVNATISLNVGTTISNAKYWSSTEDATSQKVSAIDFSSGAVSTEFKTTVLNVSGIKTF